MHAVDVDPSNDPTAAEISACTARIDCLNNGGVPDDSDLVLGTCILGSCSFTTGTDCGGIEDCPSGETCNPDPDSCHQQPLELDKNEDDVLELDFEPPGPAGSQKACNDAISNACTLISLTCP